MLGWLVLGEVPPYSDGCEQYKDGLTAVVRVCQGIAYKILRAEHSHRLDHELEMHQKLLDHARKLYLDECPILPIVGLAPYEVFTERRFAIATPAFDSSLKYYCKQASVSCAGIFEKLALPILKSVHVAHSAGVVLRDLKLDNFLIKADGIENIEVVACDFGMAREIKNLSEEQYTLYGNNETMAPECLHGMFQEVNPLQRDLYALGIMLYQLLTKVYPYEIRPYEPEERVKVYRTAHLSGVLIDDPKLGIFKDLVFKLLEKDPAQRYQTIEEVMKDFNKLVNGEIGS